MAISAFCFGERDRLLDRVSRRGRADSCPRQQKNDDPSTARHVIYLRVTTWFFNQNPALTWYPADDIASRRICSMMPHFAPCSPYGSSGYFWSFLVMNKIRIAVVGVGNCASSLLQGINFYRDSSGNGADVGLMHRQIGPYQPQDIEVVAAFDIDRRKVGLDAAEAIFALPNCTKVFCKKIKPTGAIVMMGCVFDGYAAHMRDYDAKRTFLPLEKNRRANRSSRNCASPAPRSWSIICRSARKKPRAFMPACALEAGLGFVNNIPVFIASDPVWAKRFADKNLPIVGDDIKAQMGATVLHRTIVDLFRKRGVKSSARINSTPAATPIF